MFNIIAFELYFREYQAKNYQQLQVNKIIYKNVQKYDGQNKKKKKEKGRII